MRADVLLALFLLNLAPADLPLTPGTWWEYREWAREKIGPLWAANEFTTRFEIRGLRERPYIHQEGGADPTSGPVESGDDWLRLLPWTGEEPLPWPLRVGAAGAGADGLPGWRVEAEETTSVPAGDYRAFRCTLRTATSRSVLWVAPGVGVVREEHGAPGSPPELERVLLRWSGSPSATAPQPTPARPRPAPTPRPTQ